MPEKSIFLFDPLLILTVLLAVVLWRRFSPAVKAYMVTMALLLLAYLCFYGRYFAWAGDSAWGDRYVSTTVELATLLAVPLLLQFRRQEREAVWAIGMVLMVASAVVQAASVAFWLPLEIYQMVTRGHPTFVIGLRLENIVAFALGKMDAWGLNNEAMKVGRVGLCPHDELEFPAVSAAAGGRGSSVGGADDAGAVGGGAGGAGSGSVAIEEGCCGTA